MSTAINKRGSQLFAFILIVTFRNKNWFLTVSCMAHIIKDPLFPPFSEKTAAQFPARKEVPLLDNASYILYKEACARLVSDWLNGKVGEGAPTEDWEKQLIAEVIDQTRRQVGSDDKDQSLASDKSREQQVARIYQELVERKALTHLRTATSHRKWIRLSLEFCQIAGASFSGDMVALIRRHDLSKYTPEEVLGYAVMFGDGQVNWKPLEIETEKNEWNLALEHHYVFNPHHPEYFYPKQDDGQREKFSIMEADSNGKLYLEESLIDMLASRGERNLKDDPTISLKKWMDIADVYMKRYSEEDKTYVISLLKEWNGKGEVFVADSANADRLNKLFGRAVVA